jgi:hypothetical protein
MQEDWKLALATHGPPSRSVPAMHFAQAAVSDPVPPQMGLVAQAVAQGPLGPQAHPWNEDA